MRIVVRNADDIFLLQPAAAAVAVAVVAAVATEASRAGNQATRSS